MSIAHKQAINKIFSNKTISLERIVRGKITYVKGLKC